MSSAEQGPGQGDRPFVVFNLTQWDRREVVEATVWDNAPRGALKPLKERRFEVRGAGAGSVPAQMVASGHYWGHEYVTLAFPVEAAGLGYSTCVVAESGEPVARAEAQRAEGARPTGPTHHCQYALYERSPEGLENELVRVDFDPSTGGIRSLVEKRKGFRVMSPTAAAPLLEFAVERPHGMTAWSVDHTGPVEHPRVTSFARRLGGPYKASLEFGLRVRESDLTLTYELRANDPCLYVHVRGTWFERGTRETGVPVLRAAFRLALRDAVARYEVPFGAVERRLNSGEETPALRWACVHGTVPRGGRAGCLLINDSKHGHSLDGETLRLTLIRSSYDPDPLPEIGAHEIHLGLVPFSARMTDAEAIRLAGGFASALRTVGTGVHEGPLPESAQFASVSPGNVILSALKKAEDEDALVARLYEASGVRAAARFRVNEKLLGRLLKATEVDLIERPVGASGARARKDSASVSVPAHGIESLLLKLGRRRAK
jgi:alpha-mannosidase